MSRDSLPPWWRPDRFARRRPFLHQRAAVIRAVRATFEARDFIEVETPALQVSPGMEPHLMAFATDLEPADGGAARRLYLHTSPEFAMKKLLVAGEPRIFQLAKTYRNRERSPTHSPEFTMLEWYRAGADLDELMADCEALVRAAAAACGRDTLCVNGRDIPIDQDFERLSVEEAFLMHAGIDLFATIDDPRAPTPARLREAATEIGIATGDDDSWEDIFFKISLDRIEPHLGEARPTFLTDWPISMAALSRPNPADPRVAERFELYAGAVELANAFGELTDAAEQRRRFEADCALKERLYGFRYPIDEDFLAALAWGLPPCAGIALGIDRLAMVAAGAATIEDVLWAPVAGA
ncbi:EF-P lysine aminoacylase EpmA [Zavarzinia compransoris]|uniref:EF-P lysine aminoacylase GenX n=1 Tax=Zavarzinia compransoris TaxID=1264899 RepID=A0A317DXG4_9PROT|nr:EF-P lysine aminoacylase EpmA [Zavarzinia compransoris]PWR19162.1 EF-P lysine aminoacylase GenX [Zavarzinia compransoris]TDP49177.1 lysyl-tRNA synthetase class 2 [Zavarzinia compransoris]